MYDRMVENPTMREFIEAQPADSWRDASIALAGPVEFRAITSGFERAVTASLARDGSASKVSLPGTADRIRVFERRPATMPPGIAVIPESDTPIPTEDVIAGTLSLPSGRIVADGYLGADAVPLQDRAAPGSYPVFVTVARFPDIPHDQVAFATVVVSDAPIVAWVADDHRRRRWDGQLHLDGGPGCADTPDHRRDGCRRAGVRFAHGPRRSRHGIPDQRRP